MARSRQLELPLRTWGGRREGAGRKPHGPRAGVPHVARPEHKARHPVHVTLRAARRLVSLRKQSVFAEIRRALGCASRASFRLLHFSVQSDHMHLIVEATDRGALSRGTAGLSIRVARAINRSLRRRGRVWGDRYHARALRSPREVRSGFVYVLTNWRKHLERAWGLDPCASGAWFDGWKTGPASWMRPSWDAEPSPVVAARTWLASKGWRRYGLVDVRERPKDG